MIIKVEGVGNMSNMELEMKIKNVNEKDLIERIVNKQIVYTFK